jgi:hypothetical protein
MVVSVEIKKKRREEGEGGQGRRSGGALIMGEEATRKATSRTHCTVSWATGRPARWRPRRGRYITAAGRLKAMVLLKGKRDKK